jgi:UDP-N-acetylglucosamine 1-carboxyvinyltransferase
VEVETLPFPGFPTDLQAQLTTLLTQVNGVSRVKENIFNNRFKHTSELNKLGADIEIAQDTSIIKGKTNLTGREITATDLRASAALVLGGLIAEGETVVNNSYQLLRGYEDMPRKLQELGADVTLSGVDNE